jgi:predicted RecB family nuclease
MSRTITSEILVAYSQCPRKAFLLLCAEEKGIPHEYVQILQQKRDDNQNKHIEVLKHSYADVHPYTMNNFVSGSNFLVNVTLNDGVLEVQCGLLTKVESSSSLCEYNYEPTIFVGTHSISKEQELELLFVGYVLGRLQNRLPSAGRIVGENGESHKVLLETNIRILYPFLEPLQEWLAAPPPEPPVILNRHCPYCQFQSLCTKKAEHEDNISLLSGVTPKSIRKYGKKGIFTTKQLSHLFKPRKRKRRVAKSNVVHLPELQALALRTGKIYLQELPHINRQSTELFLDIEGIPDQHFFYLIGLLVCESENSVYYSFWADILQNESMIWQQFLEKLGHYSDAPIYHYGSYEPKALSKLAKRYDTDIDNIKNRLININTYIYGKIYFPVRSNKLKEIGAFIGANWTSSNASGLQTLVWRHYWDKTRNAEYYNVLITYNKEDCLALKFLTDELSKIETSADILSEVDFINQPKECLTGKAKQVRSQFELILEFAHAKYDERKIRFRQDDEDNAHLTVEEFGAKDGYQGQRKVRPKPMKTIRVPREEFCPKHEMEHLKPKERVSKRLIIDLTLTRTGIRKTITEYTGFQGYCSRCHRYYNPPGIRQYRVNQLYGHGFKAWIVYQRVALRMSYASIAEVMEEQFNEKEPGKSIGAFIRDFGRYYAETENIIVKLLLESPFIHADETPINIRGNNHYVWVFTDGKHAIFKLRKTREAIIVHDFLADYDGILISDFYSGYDSVKCKQQKCWVHLIRDINDDLRESPFDIELEAFVLEVRNLIVPIMEEVQRYGLKKQYLSRFKVQVEEFYGKAIINKYYKSELVIKYQERFTRYRGSLFTFLEQDGIPWHNNTAERAIRHIAIQGKISGFLHEAVTQDYLLLLGIRQACRFIGESYFKFLFSGETNPKWLK